MSEIVFHPENDFTYSIGEVKEVLEEDYSEMSHEDIEE